MLTRMFCALFGGGGGVGKRGEDDILMKMPNREKYLREHILYSLAKGSKILAWARKNEMYPQCTSD